MVWKAKYLENSDLIFNVMFNGVVLVVSLGINRTIEQCSYSE